MGVNLALPSRPVYGILLGFRKIGTKLELIYFVDLLKLAVTIPKGDVKGCNSS